MHACPPASRKQRHSHCEDDTELFEFQLQWLSPDRFARTVYPVYRADCLKSVVAAFGRLPIREVVRTYP